VAEIELLVSFLVGFMLSSEYEERLLAREQDGAVVNCVTSFKIHPRSCLDF
jgi:hypothetical protein